jgi:hypothetical protein
MQDESAPAQTGNGYLTIGAFTSLTKMLTIFESLRMTTSPPMTSVALVHPKETLTVPAPQAITKCTFFQQNVALAGAPYPLRSSVALDIFRQFAAAIEGNPIEITSENSSGLSQLCEEFGFEELRSKLSSQPPSQGRKAEDPEARARIAALEEWAHRRDSDSAGFHRKFARLEADIGRLASEVSQMRSGPAAEKISREVTRLQSDVSAEKAKVAAMSAPSAALPAVQPSLPAPAPFPGSAIISDFPEIFAEFRGKHFEILWRGSRDGFQSRRISPPM